MIFSYQKVRNVFLIFYKLKFLKPLQKEGFFCRKENCCECFVSILCQQSDDECVIICRNLQDRLKAASKLDDLDDLPGPLLADNLKNEASKAYGGMPDRLYIVQEGKVVYQGGFGVYGYKVSVDISVNLLF